MKSPVRKEKASFTVYWDPCINIAANAGAIELPTIPKKMSYQVIFHYSV
jgi:hypothetical protein